MGITLSKNQDEMIMLQETSIRLCLDCSWGTRQNKKPLGVWITHM